MGEHYVGDGVRSLEHVRRPEQRGHSGLAAAQTGKPLDGVALEADVNYLTSLLKVGCWQAAVAYARRKIADPQLFHRGDFARLEPDEMRQETQPSPVQLAIIEGRLRIHLRQGEWRIAADMLVREREQAIDDEVNGETEDCVRVHRTHPHNYGQRGGRRTRKT